MSGPIRLVADVDTGIDDMLALIYLAGLHRAGEIELAAVTTTAGNTTSAQAAANSRWILDLCGCPSVPVAAGPAAPLRVPLTTTPETHGDAGLGYAAPPGPPAAAGPGERASAVDLWGSSLDDGPAHLLVTGPLTTVASHPDVAARFGRITVMGGAVDHPGNTTPTAEWNFWVDPDAVAAVLGSGLPVTLCPLDVTETIIVGPPDIGEWAIGGQLGDVVADALRFYFEFHESQGIGYLAQVHDLFAAMVACGTVDVGVEAMGLCAVVGDRGAIERGGRAGGVNVTVVKRVDPEAVRGEFRRSLAL